VFLVGRDPDEVLKLDVQAPGIALLRLMHVSVDRERGVVRAGLLGFIGDGLAEYRPGKGCTVVPDGKLDTAPVTDAPLATPGIAATTAIPASAATPASVAATGPPVLLRPSGDASAAVSLWPDGTAVQLNSDVERVLNDDELAGPGARAIIVVDHGRIVGERYATGFNADTPLLGWSMTKTVTAGVIGMLIKDGKLALDQAGFWPGATDGREKIRLSDLLAMSSGLQWNEAYGAVSDVTGMLYLQPDMAAYARAQPLAHPVGKVWSYSSGTAVILAHIAQEAAGEDIATFTNSRLFNPLRITSATI
jgi:CubicO group peptidase (beta-lactamase class C family)